MGSPEDKVVREMPATAVWERDSQVDVVLHQPHASIAGPALLVVVAHDVLVVGVRMLRQVPLDQISGLVCCKPAHIKWLSNPSRIGKRRVPVLTSPGRCPPLKCRMLSSIFYLFNAQQQ